MREINRGIAVIISYYNAVSPLNLEFLISQIQSNESSKDVHCVVVVNAVSNNQLNLYNLEMPVSVIYRENRGMNIGAWEFGWRSSFTADRFIFLQDECKIIDKDWLNVYERKMQDGEIGLLGESINHDMTWDRFLQHRKPHRAAARRELFDEIKKLGIDPGPSSRHLQSLVWAARRDVLERIGGFPIGNSKMQCIASEVGVSLKVLDAGLTIQLAGERRFQCVSHPQWDPASTSAAVTAAKPVAPEDGGN